MSLVRKKQQYQDTQLTCCKNQTVNFIELPERLLSLVGKQYRATQWSQNLFTEPYHVHMNKFINTVIWLQMFHEEKKSKLYFFPINCLPVEICDNAAIEVMYNIIFYAESIQGYCINQMR